MRRGERAGREQEESKRKCSFLLKFYRLQGRGKVGATFKVCTEFLKGKDREKKRNGKREKKIKKKSAFKRKKIQKNGKEGEKKQKR